MRHYLVFAYYIFTIMNIECDPPPTSPAPRTVHLDADFKETIQLANTKPYVDKSLLIKELVELRSEKIVVITRPSRFGKTVNLDMLRRFFEYLDHDTAERDTNKLLFVGGTIDDGRGSVMTVPSLQIAKHEDLVNRYQGKFPVITISFKFEHIKSYDDFLDAIRKEIGVMVRGHQYLITLPHKTSAEIDDRDHCNLGRLLYHVNDLSLEEIIFSLKFFVEMIHRYHKKLVVVLIDDYDMPWSRAYRLFGNGTEYEKVHYIMVKLLSLALRSTAFIERAVIAGTAALCFYDGYKVSTYTLLDEKFSQYYGFTEHDVHLLLDNEAVKYDLDQIRRWYGGYLFGRESIFNPQSVIECLNNHGQFHRYWNKIDIDEEHMLANISSSIYVTELNDLVNNNDSVPWIRRPFSYEVPFERLDVVQYLLFHGFLTATPAAGGEVNRYSMTVPNNEIASILKNLLGN